MKYLVRLIALPFWAIIYLIFAVFSTFLGLSRLCYEFILYGGEQITHDDKKNRNTIFEVYQKLEQIEASFKVDPRSNCNHAWDQEVGCSKTTALRQKCVICGVQNTIKTF